MKVTGELKLNKSEVKEAIEEYCRKYLFHGPNHDVVLELTFISSETAIMQITSYK